MDRFIEMICHNAQFNCLPLKSNMDRFIVTEHNYKALFP